MYFNYHSKVKKILEQNIVIKIDILEKYNNISPCMLLYFKNHPPIPIREHKWDYYIDYLFNPINSKK